MKTAPFDREPPFVLAPSKPESAWRKVLRLIFSRRATAGNGGVGTYYVFSGALNSGNQGVSGCEGQHQANDSGLYAASAAGLSRLNAVDGQGDNSGLLINVYSNDIFGVNLSRGFPYHNGTLLHNFSHHRAPSLKARLGRSCRAFVNAWRAK